MPPIRYPVTRCASRSLARAAERAPAARARPRSESSRSLVPGDRELSLRGLARAAGARSAALASERDAQRVTGYRIGGISPFGSKTALPVYAVAGWLERERVALNGGARGLIIELASADLARLLSPIPIAE